MATRTDPAVEVLTVTDCPRRDVTVERLREALDRIGTTQTVVAERVIDDAAAAAAFGMHGSPTVLINGCDPFTRAGDETSVSCRLYPTVTGFDGAPSVEDLIAALSQVE